MFIFHFVFNREFLASSGFLDCLIIFITTSSLNFKKFSKKSFKLQVFGLLSTIAKVLKPNELSMDVYLYNCLLIVSGSTLDLKSIATLIPSLLDSSLISLIPSIFFSLTNSAILSFKTDLFT